MRLGGLKPKTATSKSRQPKTKKKVDTTTASAGNKITTFQAKVYLLTCQIPSGKYSTYSLLAAALGSHSRAVGQALRRNPFAPTVPCHRIVTADRKIGGFSGATSGPLIAKKIELLRSEGVSFTDGEADETKCFSAFDKEALETTNLGQEMKKWRGESSK